MKQNPKTMIKCKFSNEVHNLFNSLLTEKEQKMNHTSKAWWLIKKLESMSDADKIKLFNEIVMMHKETSNELGNYRTSKRLKKQVEKARIERGYVPKKKTSKDEYLKSAKAA